MRSEARCRWRITALGLCLLVAAPVAAEVRVIDGDTISVDGARHRLFGIDAAERRQSCRDTDGRIWDCAGEATQALTDLVRNRQVVCEEVPNTRDGFGRTISRCRVGEQDLGDALVRAGLAWAFRRYSTDYVDAENEARRAKSGVWSVSPTQVNEPPWAWRARQRELQANRPQADAPDPDCQIKGNISQSGRIYHMPGTRDWAATRINEGRGERWFCTEQQAIAAGWRAPGGG